MATLAELIKAHGSVLTRGGPRPAAAIQSLQSQFDVLLPSDYRQFLGNYGYLHGEAVTILGLSAAPAPLSSVADVTLFLRLHYEDMPLEAAVALQRGYFVAQSRRVARLPYQEWPAGADNMPDGTCYSYNHDVVARALRIEGTVWDLTDKPELLLRFHQRP